MINNERGFALLNVIFLMMITSFAAMILLNAAPRVKNPQPTLRLTALYLANEQFAYLEDKAAKGELTEAAYEFLGDPNELTTNNFSEKIAITFDMETTVTGSGNLRNAKVIVSWTFGGKDFKIDSERTILFVKHETEDEEETP